MVEITSAAPESLAITADSVELVEQAVHPATYIGQTAPINPDSPGLGSSRESIRASDEGLSSASRATPDKDQNTVHGDTKKTSLDPEKHGSYRSISDVERAASLKAHGINTEDALTPELNTEDMFLIEHDPFAFSLGHLSKLFNPKSLDAFYALRGPYGLEKGLRTNRKTGLDVDEIHLEYNVLFEDAATPGAPKYGACGETLPVSRHGNPVPERIPTPAMGGVFSDRKRVFSANRLHDEKTKPLFRLAWDDYHTRHVLILLTIVAVIAFGWGLGQDLGQYRTDEVVADWIEEVAIFVYLLFVVGAGILSRWKKEQIITAYHYVPHT
ncbi:hypothetical protein B0T25DRAFT_279086 [Lasiosphaeria hispida]|uniref:Cation-transporting P-type ATPase N-terminal domain-containing protein n=1 Tax=Lasiosphaeria hispida TaxID=260671 RepID=A0AAJ0HBB4_9PEZI|nr:hypothetical protein B0T25DRAFT_279086 [Lasiosphaeria hispida]